jgi:hypothetical protein
VTPADKPGSTGQNTERESDHKSGVATDGQAKVEQTGDNHDGAQGNGKAQVEEPTARVATPDDLELSHGTPPPWQRVTSDNASTPASSATTQPTSATTQPTKTQPTTPPRGESTTPPAGSPPSGLPSVPSSGPSSPSSPSLFTPANDLPVRSEPSPGGRSEPVGEKTVSIERPVVTGAAAARLFADGLPTAATVPAPGTGMPHGGAAPSRTTVHLEGAPAVPAPGPMRVSAAAPSALRRPGRGPRRANLQIKRFDPWSVLKLSLVLGVALFFVWLVAVGVLYAVLDGMGVWDKLNGISSEILQPTDGGSGEPLISAGRVFGVAAIIGAVNIVLFSALSTVGAFIYNVSADLAGGLEVTLAERE